MKKKITIEVKNVSKSFFLHDRGLGTLRRLLEFLGKKKEVIHVLENVSFEAKSNEILGIIGSNGSGKSTLLRILAGIYPNYNGRVIMRGKIVPVINLGIAFQENLTAIENILIYGLLLGMTRDDAKRKINSIISFAELQGFEGVELRKFSEGMKQRLAFSVAIHVPFDILLLDEALAIGDIEFKRKCERIIKKLKEEGKTIIFVSHDPYLIWMNCDRVLWLERGKVKTVGGKEVINKYLNYSLGIKKLPWLKNKR